MKLLVKTGNKELENILKNLSSHSVEITDQISSKNIRDKDCLIILSSFINCLNPEEFNLKIQDIYNTLSLSVEEGIDKIIMVSSLEIFNY